MKKLMCLLCLLVNSIPVVKAVPMDISILPTVEAYVKSNAADLVAPTAAIASGLRPANDSTVPISQKIYVKFKLPDDVGTINYASLQFNQIWSTGYYTNVSIYGLKDSANADDWTGSLSSSSWITNTGEASSGITWNNAPANVTSSLVNFDSNAEAIGNLVTSNNGGSRSACNVSLTFSNTNLSDFIADDSDGYVTIMLSQSDNLPWTYRYLIFGSTLKTGSTPITLTLNYEPVPEPATVLLLTLGGFGILRKRNKL